MFQDRLQAQLVPALQAAFDQLFNASVEAKQFAFQPTRPEFEGDVTINVFPFLKQTGKGPEQSATAIGEHLKANLPIVERFNVVKGFLNIVITDSYWLGFLKEAGETDILQFPSNGKKVMVEYASPNTNKPLHLGHLRNIFLGYSVSRILKSTGNEVVRVQVVNDRGIHICKSMLAWQKFGNGENPTADFKGDKLVGKYYVAFDKAFKAEVEQLVSAGRSKEEAEKEAPILLEAQAMLRKWEANDPEVRALWEKMNGWVYDGFNASYARMGVDFDKNYYESQTYVLGKNDVLEGLKKGVFYEKDGAIWVDNTPEGLDEKVLLRRDGTSVYMTQDIGTAIKRFEEYPGLSKLIYTVGNEQDYHFKVLFLILRKLGFPWASELFHLSYGMVDLPSGKMKSREGTVVDADDLMKDMVQVAEVRTKELGKLDGFSESEKALLFEQIGLAALKYFLLKVDAKKRMLFDPATSIDHQGHTGPFIQYAYARGESVYDKVMLAAVQGLWHGYGPHDIPRIESMLHAPNGGLMSEERTLLKLIHHFPSVLNDSAERLDPSALANHAYEIAKAYNAFYHAFKIRDEEDPTKAAFRLSLSRNSARVIFKSMWCLGIEVPRRM